MPISTHIYPLLAALLAVCLPFVAFLLATVLGKQAKNGTISIIAIALSLLAAGYVFACIWGLDPIHVRWHWFTIGERAFYVGVLLDNLSVLMLLLVCTVALPVHIYSAAYMKGDPRIHRYWAYLSLFCFAMLGVVVADNLLLLYVFWELVGLASYLLIGFWFTKTAAVQANKKAFLINRIGDIGFLIGIAILYSFTDTLAIRELFGSESNILSDGKLTGGWVTAAGLAFFLGAMAKSAQFPLHVWLPDAMEGPTSVSSLIHAATMVAAGVFLLARVFPLFDETTLIIMAFVGTVTAFIAAFFALTQNDIKKILAFSTISQLGFMVAGVGIGMYPTALFHLVTHAFFKCLLFLCAGAIIHAMQHVNEQHRLNLDPQDIRNMGGFRRHMPITFATMLVASLALMGFPFTAGYLSKDALLVHAFEWSALQSGIARIIPYILSAVAILTSFYMLRLLIKVFFGRSAFTSVPDVHIHDAPVGMRIPMIFLAVCSLFPLFTLHPLNDGHVWLLQGFATSSTLPPLRLLHFIIPAVTTSITICVAVVAWHWYVNGKYPLKDSGMLHRLSLHQGYFNACYDVVIVRPVLWLSRRLLWFDGSVVDGSINVLVHVGRRFAQAATWVDQRIVDGLVRLAGKLAWGLGNVFRRSQTGRVQHYLALVFLIIVVILLYHIFVPV